jgi:hypothetical protein
MIKSKLSFIVFSSPKAYLPFLVFLFDPEEGLVSPRLRGAFHAFTSDCTDDGLSPRRALGALEEPRLMLSLDPDLDFLGLRLLTPLRPIFSPCF